MTGAGEPAACLRLGAHGRRRGHSREVRRQGAGRQAAAADQRRAARTRSASPARRWSSSSTASASAARWTASRAGCRRAARASTRSAARATRTMPRSPRRCGSTTWPSSTTARTPSRSTASKKLPGQTPCWDMLLSFAASAEDPISGGRHKVIGSKPLVHPAADQHHRLASAQGGRRGVQHRHRQDAEARGHRRCRATRSCCAASATPRPTIRPRRARSTPPPGPPIRARRCRSSSCARTMASASRPGRRAAGSRRRSATAPGSNMSIAAASTWSTPIAARARPRDYRPHRAQAGLPAHGLRPALRPCRLRRAGHLSHQGADRGGRGARSAALQRRPAGRAGPAVGQPRSSTSTTRPRRRSPGSPSRRSRGPSSPPARR